MHPLRFPRGRGGSRRHWFPPVDHPTAADVLGNLRSLCGSCDAAIKEQRNGTLSRGGRLVNAGCDADGWPLPTTPTGGGRGGAGF